MTREDFERIAAKLFDAYANGTLADGLITQATDDLVAAYNQGIEDCALDFREHTTTRDGLRKKKIGGEA